MNMEFHFVLYYLISLIGFHAIIGLLPSLWISWPAEPRVINPVGPNNISFYGQNNDNLICKTNLRTVSLSLSQAWFVWLYPFLIVLVGSLYRHISVLFAFSLGSLEYHWLPVLPFGWCGKYLKRNRYVQILTRIMTKLLVVQPKVLPQELSPLNYTWSHCLAFASVRGMWFVGNHNYIPKTFI